jgi:GH35 family endo-1,4-beta-xylanase
MHVGRSPTRSTPLAKDFKNPGVPIDGVGLQMHNLNLQFDAAAVAANYFSSHRLQVHITESDVAVPVNFKWRSG